MTYICFKESNKIILRLFDQIRAIVHSINDQMESKACCYGQEISCAKSNDLKSKRVLWILY